MADQKFSVNCGFFDSVNRDRLYTADQMNKPYKRVITNGVFATPQGTPSTDLKVQSANNAMNIVCKAGEGLFGDKWFENPTDFVITVPANTDITPRRDSVIVQVDKRTAGRNGSIVYRTGTPSSNPQVPPIGTVDNVIEYRIANVYVAPSANYIGQDAIVDLRGSSECPWITSLIKQVDTSALFDQFNAAYWGWYDRTQEAWDEFMRQIHDDLAVNTNIITAESHYTTTQNGETVIPINITGFNRLRDVLMVRVNHLFVSEGTDYTIASNSSTITLTKDLNAGNNIDFIMLKSVVVGDTETLITTVGELTEAISALEALHSDSNWINFILEAGSSFSSSTTPAVRKYGNMVNIRGAVKGITATGTTICTLPASMRPAMNYQYSVSAISSGSINATAVIEVSASNGEITLIAKSGTIDAAAMLPIATNFVVG